MLVDTSPLIKAPNCVVCLFDASCNHRLSSYLILCMYVPLAYLPKLMYVRPFVVQEVSGEEMARRKESWKIPAERQKVIGLLGKYRKSVSSAHIGAVTF